MWYPSSTLALPGRDERTARADRTAPVPINNGGTFRQAFWAIVRVIYPVLVSMAILSFGLIFAALADMT